MLTFGELKSSRALRIAGACPDSESFAQLANDSIRVLMRRGNWWATVMRMTGCIYDNCIVWPRQVSTPLAINKCGGSIPPKNHWYGFSAVLPEDVTNQGRFGDRCWGDVAARDDGTTSIFNQVPCLNPRYLRFYPSQPTDVGKTITIFGVDSNGQTIRSERADSTFQDGVVLTLAIPYAQTTFLVSRVDRIIKDQTNGPIYGYQFDGATLYDLAAYAAAETNPDYRKSRIVSGCATTARAAGCCPAQITALVKLAFVPVQYDDDLCGIDNIDAIALGMQAVKQSDSYDSVQAEAMTIRAVKELNAQLRERLPIDTVQVNFQPYGTASLNRLNIGRMI